VSGTEQNIRVDIGGRVNPGKFSHVVCDSGTYTMLTGCDVL